jgi:hypothetical protein
MEYRFKYEIVDEDGAVYESGSTYIIPESINQFGECESVDMEVASSLRHFPKHLRRLEQILEGQQLEDEDDDNLCGKAHNNGSEEDCLECGVIRAGI